MLREEVGGSLARGQRFTRLVCRQDGWPMTILTLEWFALLGAMDDAHAVAARILTRLEHTGRLVTLSLPPLWLPELARIPA